MKNFFLIVFLFAFVQLTFAQNQIEPPTRRDVSTKYKTYALGGLAAGTTKNSVPVDSITVIDGVWRVYKNGVQLNTPDREYIGIDTTGLKSTASKIALTTRYDFKTEFAGDPLAKALNGWTTSNDIEGAPMCPLNFQAGSGLTSGTIVLTAMNPVTDTSRWSGVTYCLSTAFSGTIGAFNAIGIYRVDGGTYTLVASTGNVTSLWNVAGAKQVVAFTTPLTVYPGQLFYSACLYISSAQTTAPVTVDVGILTNNYSQYWLGGDNKLTSTLAGQTSLPATITASATTRAVYMKGFLTYK